MSVPPSDDLTWEWREVADDVSVVITTCYVVLESSKPLDPFYHSAPRFVHALDDAARESLLSAYSEAFNDAAALAVELGGRDAEATALDLCAAWSHGWPTSPLVARGVGIGLCPGELERAGFDEYHELDICLNALPLENDSVHIITLNCGIPYLTNPSYVCEEAARVLVPGGTFLISFSDHIVAPERATKEWIRWNDGQRVRAIVGWLKAQTPSFATIQAADASPLKGVTNSLILVRATKKR